MKKKAFILFCLVYWRYDVLLVYDMKTVSMAEQSVDIVVIRQNSVRETLEKNVLEEKIAVIKEEKKREQEAKEAEKKEEMELN